MLNFYFHEHFTIKELRYVYNVLKDCGLQYSENPRHEQGYFNFSFDDNYWSWRDLENLGFNVTLYLNTLPFDQDYEPFKYLTSIAKPLGTRIMRKKEDLKCLVDAGHFFGFHTHSHIKISETNEKELIKEILKNRYFFEQLEIKNIVNQFAVPYGMLKYVGAKQLDLLLQEFDSVVFANPGLLGESKPHIIHRIEYNSLNSLRQNIVRAQKKLPKICTYRQFNFDII